MCGPSSILGARLKRPTIVANPPIVPTQYREARQAGKQSGPETPAGVSAEDRGREPAVRLAPESLHRRALQSEIQDHQRLISRMVGSPDETGYVRWIEASSIRLVTTRAVLLEIGNALAKVAPMELRFRAWRLSTDRPLVRSYASTRVVIADGSRTLAAPMTIETGGCRLREQ